MEKIKEIYNYVWGINTIGSEDQLLGLAKDLNDHYKGLIKELTISVPTEADENIIAHYSTVVTDEKGNKIQADLHLAYINKTDSSGPERYPLL